MNGRSHGHESSYLVKVRRRPDETPYGSDSRNYLPLCNDLGPLLLDVPPELRGDYCRRGPVRRSRFSG